ncbi:MAG: hydrogenase maturation nickel metallochaperone HypA [Thaumarchaeota archaeon]|nr:hydrogenase maturation nickel metallochaperone HypA [Nitrososphaerota archaeon]
MHEYVYADRILQSVLEDIGRTGKPSAVTVEVGEMLGLTRESLTSAYELLSKGTRAEGSKLKVKFAKGAVECPKCGFHGRLQLSRHLHAVDPAFACPKCGSSLRVSAGLGARLIRVE